MKTGTKVKNIFIYYLHLGDHVPFYIGKTKTSLSKRIYNHRRTFGNDIHIELLDIIKQNEWKFWETYWIEQIKCWGFTLKNKNNGGGGVPYHTKETRNKISNNWNNKTIEEKEYINEKRRQSNLNTKKPGAGCKFFSEEHRKNLSNSQKGSKKPKNRKSVLMLDKNNMEILKEFSSMTEASNFIGVKPSTLSGCLTGAFKTSGGYKWEYKK